jgi:hypothetical protein
MKWKKESKTPNMLDSPVQSPLQPQQRHEHLQMHTHDGGYNGYMTSNGSPAKLK